VFKKLDETRQALYEQSIRRVIWAGHVARIVIGKVTYRVLVGRLEGKRQLERPMRRWIFKKWDG